MKAVLFAVGWLLILMFGAPLLLGLFNGYALADAWWIYVFGLLIGIGLLVWRRQLVAREDLL